MIRAAKALPAEFSRRVALRSRRYERGNELCLNRVLGRSGESAGNRKPDPIQPSNLTELQNENGEFLQDHRLVELAVFVGILSFRKEADMLDSQQSNCYRRHWQFFKVQLWCLFLTHKLILLCAKYVLLNSF